MIRKAVLIASTTLAGATVLLGVLSFVKPVELDLRGPGEQVFHKGLNHVEVRSFTIGVVYQGEVRAGRGFRDRHDRFLGFRWLTSIERLHCGFGSSLPPRAQESNRVCLLEVPLWMPSVLFAACPTVAFIRGPARRYRRRRKGLCITCGYDLTGNTSGVCPECGNGVRPEHGIL